MGRIWQEKSDADSTVCAITLEGKFVEEGKPTGSVCDQTGKPPEPENKQAGWLMVFPVSKEPLSGRLVTSGPHHPSSRKSNRVKLHRGETITTFLSQRCRASVRIIIYTSQILVSIRINAAITYSSLLKLFYSPLPLEHCSGAQN